MSSGSWYLTSTAGSFSCQDIWGTLLVPSACCKKQKQTKPNQTTGLVAFDNRYSFCRYVQVVYLKTHIPGSKRGFLFGLRALIENHDPCLFWFAVAMGTHWSCFYISIVSSHLFWMPLAEMRNRLVVTQGRALRNWEPSCVS